MQNDLVLYQKMTSNPVIEALLCKNEKEALRHLVVFAEENGVLGNVFRYYTAFLMACDDNIFSSTCEMNETCGPSLFSLALQDIGHILEFSNRHRGILDGYTPTHPALPDGFALSLQKIEEAFDGGAKSVLVRLTQHYRELGRGIAARYKALEWKKGLAGIEKFDQISFDELIGIEQQKEMLVTNTERFLQKKGANNVLLFGDSGTGKSSSVKALVNQYHGNGLRLLELKKSQLTELEEVFDKLARQKHRFIIFLDDLSFEEGELGYKPLKAALEGKAALVPENVLFYVTSNRRHIIKETWADRAAESEEVHISDTMHEKLSLSERFGLAVNFSSPGQEEYIAIVKELCKKNKLDYSESIRSEALQWALYHNGRSGRTAKQFVNSLK